MDTPTLVNALRELNPAEMDWKFSIYSTRKTRDGLELEWNLCKMEAIAAWIESIKANMLEKVIGDRSVKDYSPFLSDKEYIGALDKNNALIKEQIHDIFLSINNAEEYPPEDFASGILPKAAGFAFRGSIDGGQDSRVLFMRRGNPFISGGKTRICISRDGTAVNCEEPILKFAPVADFAYIGGICYFFTSAIEKDFAFESRHIAIADRCLKVIAAAEIINNYDQLEQVSVKLANAKKYTDFDKQILDHVARLSVADRGEFLGTYGVELDGNGRINTGDPEQCGLFIDLLCCRSCLDPLGRLAVAGNITLRE